MSFDFGTQLPNYIFWCETSFYTIIYNIILYTNYKKKKNFQVAWSVKLCTEIILALLLKCVQLEKNPHDEHTMHWITIPTDTINYRLNELRRRMFTKIWNQRLCYADINNYNTLCIIFILSIYIQCKVYVLGQHVILLIHTKGVWNWKKISLITETISFLKRLMDNSDVLYAIHNIQRYILYAFYKQVSNTYYLKEY